LGKVFFAAITYAVTLLSEHYYDQRHQRWIRQNRTVKSEMNIKFVRYIFVLILVLLAVYRLLCFMSEPIADHTYFNPDGFLAIAHRGGSSLGPESTLYTFRRAVALGVDVIEIDLQRTKDGQLIVLHDRSVDRTTNGSGPADNFTLAELKNLDAAYRWSADNGRTFPLRGRGIRIPSLAEVLADFPDMRINIELKDAQAEIGTQLCQLIRKYNKTQKVMIASFNAGRLKKFRSQCPRVATSFGASEAIVFYGLQWVHLESAYSPPAQALQVPVHYGRTQLVTRRFVNAAHSRNLRVHVWTVNDTEEMQRLLELGVDGIMTDYPERLLSLLGRQIPSMDPKPNRAGHTE
jgi:glycerophosphoryl diester phosphodiesterase